MFKKGELVFLPPSSSLWREGTVSMTKVPMNLLVLDSSDDGSWGRRVLGVFYEGTRWNVFAESVQPAREVVRRPEEGENAN